MPGMPTVKLARPMSRCRSSRRPTIVIDVPASALGEAERADYQSGELESQKQQYAQVLQTLEAVAAKLQLVYEKAIVEHRQAIAKLAVEIARKILAQKVKDGDYQIESIIQEALNNAPTRQDIVVRLNPQDLARCQQMQQQGERGWQASNSRRPGHWAGPVRGRYPERQNRITDRRALRTGARALIKAVVNNDTENTIHRRSLRLILTSFIRHWRQSICWIARARW